MHEHCPFKSLVFQGTWGILFSVFYQSHQDVLNTLDVITEIYNYLHFMLVARGHGE